METAHDLKSFLSSCRDVLVSLLRNFVSVPLPNPAEGERQTKCFEYPRGRAIKKILFSKIPVVGGVWETAHGLKGILSSASRRTGFTGNFKSVPLPNPAEGERQTKCFEYSRGRAIQKTLSAKIPRGGEGFTS